ncbi:hypothetical protein [Variovorax sp. JS1663]|uniref:hypothetical protein n=1 Tax=Variovorax sp. JS1663 TaxID=1851577 RepID=UPI000B34128A|nr:hypothetical protein [Variovorax sp. JS1663]OUM04086.1 hypothetical protein A8M77_03490 [Variovorax sp. JS1663]
MLGQVLRQQAGRCCTHAVFVPWLRSVPLFRDRVICVLRLIEVRAPAAAPARQVRFPNVSLIDGPIVNSYTTSSAVAPFQLPVRTPLVGGRTTIQCAAWDRHFWIAAPVAERPMPDELWITLPGFTINATPARIAPLHYRERRQLVAASLRDRAGVHRIEDAAAGGEVYRSRCRAGRRCEA